jgi:hypothetical protein
MRLEGLVALSSTNVWVDGSASGFGKADLPVIEHWPLGGAVWTVAAASPTNVWATQNPGVIEHWDGTAWSVQFGPVNGVTFMRMAVTSDGGAWAVGREQLGFQYEAYTARWTGSAWVPEPTSAAKFHRSDLAGIDPCPRPWSGRWEATGFAGVRGIPSSSGGTEPGGRWGRR